MRWPALQAACRRLILTADGIVPPGVEAAKRLRIERQMLDLLASGMREALITSIIIGPVLTTWLTLPHIGVARALLPLVLLLVFGAERVIMLRRMARERALRDDTPRRWAWAIGARLTLGACVVVLWFHFAAQSGNRMLISEMVALLTILAAGGAALFSSWPPVMWSVVSILLLGMAARLVSLGDAEHLVEAAFCVVLWVVLVSASVRSARTLHGEALALLRNEELVRELHDKHERTEAAHAAKSRFFAAVNHDLRQPLHAMGLYLGLLRRDGDDASADADVLARVHECMRGMDRMLQSLLDVARLESGQLAPAPRAFALQPLFDRLASVHAVAAADKGLRLRVRATGAWVRSDPALLERALSNLLGNALRYTEHGGVLLAARPRGECVRLCVMDTGVGIPEQARELVFEEFVQLGNPQRDPARGHGLGLATVRRLAALLQLDLALRSRVGKGSVFTLDVSVAAPEAQPGDAAARQALRLRGRVLVVEDHAPSRDALVRQLTHWGLEVVGARDADVARAELAHGEFDAVLSDWRLPGAMDGVAVLREARARLPRLRLALLVTGEGAQRLDALGREFPVLRKPLRPLRLRTLLARYLPTA